MKRALLAVMLIVFVACAAELRAKTLLDGFEDASTWNWMGGDIVPEPEKGMQKKCVGFKFGLTDEITWAGVAREYDPPINLPSNYNIEFYIKGEGKKNTLEFKLMGVDGNVFMKKWNGFELPGAWKKMTIDREEITFGWGPDPKAVLEKVKRIEVVISKGEGGAGKVYVDELSLNEMGSSDITSKITENRKATASSNEAKNTPEFAVDDNMATRWSSEFSDPQWIEIEFEDSVPVDKIKLCWESAYAKEYQVQVSDDKKKWYVVYEEKNGSGGTNIIRFNPVSVKYLKVYGVSRGTDWGYSLWEIEAYRANGNPVPLSKFKQAE
ncbi:MAG: discoidin domain-containing protein [Elusimicrobiota bacterium]